jgi:hypothetical protein
LIKLSGSILFFLKSKHYRFNYKKKSISCNQVFDRVLPGGQINPPGQPDHPNFNLLYFFLNPVKFQPQIGQVPNWPVGSGFKTIIFIHKLDKSPKLNNTRNLNLGVIKKFMNKFKINISNRHKKITGIFNSIIMD